MAKGKKQHNNDNLMAQNKKARHDYSIWKRSKPALF